MSSADYSNSASGLMEDTLLVDLDVAWVEREEEAVVLGSRGYDSMALALRVYALEARLKVVICRHLRLPCLPKSCETHDLSALIVYTGRIAELMDPANIALRENWDLLVQFSRDRLNGIRYVPRGKNWNPGDLQRRFDALDNPKDGVLAWLSRHP